MVTAGAPNTQVLEAERQLPHPFRSGRTMLEMAAASGKSIAQLMLENELVWHGEAEVRAGLLHIWDVMQACVARGCRTDGLLPGPFQCAGAPRNCSAT